MAQCLFQFVLPNLHDRVSISSKHLLPYYCTIAAGCRSRQIGSLMFDNTTALRNYSQRHLSLRKSYPREHNWYAQLRSRLFIHWQFVNYIKFSFKALHNQRCFSTPPTPKKQIRLHSWIFLHSNGNAQRDGGVALRGSLQADQDSTVNERKSRDSGSRRSLCTTYHF